MLGKQQNVSNVFKVVNMLYIPKELIAQSVQAMFLDNQSLHFYGPL